MFRLTQQCYAITGCEAILELVISTVPCQIESWYPKGQIRKKLKRFYCFEVVYQNWHGSHLCLCEFVHEVFVKIYNRESYIVLVFWYSYLLGAPFSLEVGVIDHRGLPFSIHLIIPVFRLGGVWVGDVLGPVPLLGLGVLGIGDGWALVPVFGLLCFGVLEKNTCIITGRKKWDISVNDVNLKQT